MWLLGHVLSADSTGARAFALTPCSGQLLQVAVGAEQGGAIGAPPAVINAVADALASLGVSLTEGPLSPSRLLDLIDDARS